MPRRTQPRRNPTDARGKAPTANPGTKVVKGYAEPTGAGPSPVDGQGRRIDGKKLRGTKPRRNPPEAGGKAPRANRGTKVVKGYADPTGAGPSPVDGQGRRIDGKKLGGCVRPAARSSDQ